MTTGALHSQVNYGFDLDKRRLLVEDYDVVVPDVPFEIKKSFRVKVISKDAIGMPGAELRQLKGLQGSTEQSLQFSSPVPPEVAEATIRNGEIYLHVRGPMWITPESPMMLKAQYEVPLRGDGDRLLHCGAVQPSDIEDVRKWLGLKVFTKTVRLFAFSSLRLFTARVVDGSNPVSYPIPLVSERQSVHMIRKDLRMELDLVDWMRAKYFALEVELGASDPIPGSAMPDMGAMTWSSE